MKAKLIYEAFEKKSKEQARAALLWPILNHFYNYSDAANYVKNNWLAATLFDKNEYDKEDTDCMLPQQFKNLQEWFYAQKIEEGHDFEEFWDYFIDYDYSDRSLWGDINKK